MKRRRSLYDAAARAALDAARLIYDAARIERPAPDWSELSKHERARIVSAAICAARAEADRLATERNA